MKKIPLTHGKYALVDNEDYVRLSKYKWVAIVSDNRYTCYAQRNIRINGKFVTTSMHRELLGLKPGDPRLGDHKDRNGLNNQKINLRIVSGSLNIYNRRMNRNNTSGYRGVSRDRYKHRWSASIGINGKRIKCGDYINIVNAAKAYDKAALKYYGKDAKLNFPLKRRNSNINII